MKWKDPGPFGIASCLDSTNSSSRVGLDVDPREISPTLTTAGALNTGPANGVAVGEGIGLVIVPIGLGNGWVGPCKTAAVITNAKTSTPINTKATTARNVLSLKCRRSAWTCG
jgi:hypothetical protein